MSEEPQLTVKKRRVRILSVVLLTVLALPLLIILALKVYLATPLPAAQLSRFVSSQLQHDFSVQSVHLSGSTLILKGVRLQNPAGFPQGNLVSADSVAVAPQWGKLLRGAQRFDLVELREFRVNVEKNAKGVWNFASLQQVLAARKKPTAEPAVETYVRELRVKGGGVQVQGQGVQGISLRVFDLATLGSSAAGVDLTFEDQARNRYTLKGKARAGKDAALDLKLSAPSLALKQVAALMKVKDPALFEGATGALEINATLEKGELDTRGDLSFSQVRIPTADAVGERTPVKGLLRVAAHYSGQSDSLTLQRSSLAIDDLVKLQAHGSVSGLKGARQFVLQLSTDRVGLATLNQLLPVQKRKELTFGGFLSCESLRLAGDRQGLDAVVGTLRLHEGRVVNKEELLVAGVSGELDFTRRKGNISAGGRLNSSAGEKALVQSLELPLSLALSPQLKPLRAAARGFSATVAGLPIRGRLSYDTSQVDRLFADLEVAASNLARLDPYLGRYGFSAHAGTFSASVQASGKSGQDLRAAARVQLTGAKGKRGKEPYGVGSGNITANLERKGGRLLAQGTAKLADLSLKGSVYDASFGYRLADQTLYLNDTKVGIAGADVSIQRASAALPTSRTVGGVTGYPLEIEFAGAKVKQRDLELSNLAGRLRATLNSDGASRWLDGTAEVSSGASWQGKALTAPALRIAFSRAGARSALGGKLLGGTLDGSISYNPFAPDAGAAFDLRVADAALSAAAPFLPRGSAVRPTDGAVDLRLQGKYSRRDGLSSRFSSEGRGISLKNADGKGLVSDARLSLRGELARDRLAIGDATVSVGQEVVLKLRGDLTQPLTPKREGSITFALQQATLNGLIDPFVNLLPPVIQEATVDGSLAAEGTLDLRGGRKALQGALKVKEGRLEVPSQKLVLAGINGELPFSIDFSGGGRPPKIMAFSRENYPKLLDLMQTPPIDGKAVTIAKITFGVFELGKLTARVSAANGVTQITSLTTSLYQGALLGRGYLTIKEKVNFRGDILVHDLSLRTLSRTLPMEGYISGRVDGIISVNGAGKGKTGLTGFVELWARKGKGEKMVVSKEFLQRLAKQKLTGFFLSADRPYDEAEIKAILEEGDLTFDALRIVNTNIFGVRDLSVSIAPGQNRIGLDHLMGSIKEAAVRGKPGAGQPGAEQPGPAAPTQEFKWGE